MTAFGTAGGLGVCLLAPAGGTDGPTPAGLYDARVEVIETEPLAPGQTGEFSVVLLESIEPAVQLGLALASDDVGLPENRLSWRDVVDPQAAQLRLRGSFVAPARPGTYRIQGLISYVRCEGAWCRTKHGRLTWTVVVDGSLVAR